MSETATKLIKLADVAPIPERAAINKVPQELRLGMSRAREYHAAAIAAQCHVIAFQALAGYELLAVRHELGETRGGARKAKAEAAEIFEQEIAEPDADDKRSAFDKVVEAFGFSRRLAYVYMSMAKKARERFAFLRELPLLTVPPSKMQASQLDELLAMLQGVTEGQTRSGFLALLGMSDDDNNTPPTANGRKPGRKETRREINTRDMRDAFASFLANFKAGHWQLLEDDELDEIAQLFSNGLKKVSDQIAKRKTA
jgi:hypothetical protein